MQLVRRVRPVKWCRQKPIHLRKELLQADLVVPGQHILCSQANWDVPQLPYSAVQLL